MSLTVFPVMFLLGATLAASLEGNVIKRFYFDSVGVNAFNLYFYNAVSFIGSAVVLCLVCDIAAVSVFTFFAAVLFGMVTALQQIFFHDGGRQRSAFIYLGPHLSVDVHSRTVGRDFLARVGFRRANCGNGSAGFLLFCLLKR